jgi:hypothetical protein
LIKKESQEYSISINDSPNEINEENNNGDYYNENTTRFEVTFYRWIQLASYILAMMVNNITLVSFTPIGSQVLI